MEFSTVDVYPEFLDFLNVFDNITPPAATAASVTILPSIFTSCKLEFIGKSANFSQPAAGRFHEKFAHTFANRFFGLELCAVLHVIANFADYGLLPLAFPGSLPVHNE